MTSWKGPLLAGVGVALGGGALSAYLLIAALFRSSNSTAAIGLLFVPFYAAAAALPFFAVGFGLGYAWQRWRRTQRILDWRVFVPALGALALFASGVGWWAGQQSQVREVQRVLQMGGKEITAYFEHSRPSDKFILGAIAQNPAASPGLLDAIARLPNPALHKKMGSLFPVMGGNTKGLAVMRLIARHPQASSATLEYLAQTSQDSYVLGDVAGNSQLSVETIKKIYTNKKPYKQGGQLIDWGVARNSRTPPPLLREIAQRGDPYARGAVARNPNTPAEDLQRLSDDTEWHVRRDVLDNPRVTQELIQRLSQDPDKRVASTAARLRERFKNSQD